MKTRLIYYSIKPLIPRRLQIGLRRLNAALKQKKHYAKWPIDPSSSVPPQGWVGWPDKKKFALVLSHDVDTVKGYDHCLDLVQLEKQMGFRSSFNFVPKGYRVSSALCQKLIAQGFSIGVHGLNHDGKLFKSRKRMLKSIPRINNYLKEWGANGFHAPSMIVNMEWVADLDIEYDCSTFDTDPFEPRPEGVGTIFPFLVENSSRTRRYIELPYTLPQDHCLFVILKEKDTRIWQEKLDWLADNGGMALLVSHPDYMNFDGTPCSFEEYPVDYYIAFLEYVKRKYAGQYWHALPGEVARFWKETMSGSIIRLASHDKGKPLAYFKKTVWIDLDNTPHVPFFIPIKKELEKRGFRVLLTARDAFQVCELALKNGLIFKMIGRHYGKNILMKGYGLLRRALALAPFALRNKPDLALSHGSRSQVLLANALGIPTVVLMDYEHAKMPPLTRPDWEIVPTAIASTKLSGKNVLQYVGLKEDVYVPFFTPDPTILGELGLSENDLVATVRPPAVEAHYHNPESEVIFAKLIEWILSTSDAKVVILPRNVKQEAAIKKENKLWFSTNRVIIPRKAYDGLNLLYFSDVVISGGGTMNREAAALGVPVYSIFRGPMGSVDRQLEAEGRLTMIATPEEITHKIKLKRRTKSILYESGNRPALGQIVNHIVAIMDSENTAVS
jgi:predicted glycosyltransferase